MVPVKYLQRNAVLNWMCTTSISYKCREEFTSLHVSPRVILPLSQCHAWLAVLLIFGVSFARTYLISVSCIFVSGAPIDVKLKPASNVFSSDEVTQALDRKCS